ncbi:TPA: conjugal transfer protein TraG N-terminal domain-containing protein [Mannheimia haemolytica]
MDLNLTVDSYFEYFLTVFGWIIGNNIWDLLIDTGLFAAPFVAHIINAFLKVREQGDDEGNKGSLLTAWLENKLYASLVIMMMCCVPLFNVSFSTLKFDTPRMKECKTTVLAPEQTGLGSLKTELNGQSAKLPLWWAFTYATSKGLTHGAIASIPCKPDLRQIRFEVQSTQIKDQFLRKEVSDFVQECFIPARTYLKNFGSIRNLGEAEAQDLAWIGSQILLGNPNLYPRIQAKTPNPFFPWNPTRDSTLPRNLGGGFPYCNVWWQDGTNGLRARLLGQIESSTWDKISAWATTSGEKDYDDKILRGMLAFQDIKAENRTEKRYDAVRTMWVDRLDFSLFSSAYKATVGTGGKMLGNVLTGPAFDVLKQSLPYVQALILFALTISMPFVIVFSGYSVKAMMAMTFGWFSVFFLSFIWEIAYWLDTSIYTALYGDDLSDSIMQMGEGFTLNLVLNTMYLVMPALWIGFLGWAGIKAGAGLDQAISGGSKNAKDSTRQGQNKAGA